MKRNTFLFILLVCLLSLSACKTDISESDVNIALPISYNIDGISVTVDEAIPVAEPIVGEAEWLSINDFVFADSCDLITKAKVADIREVNVTYTKEITRTFYCSLIELAFEKIYYSVDERDNDQLLFTAK